MISANYDLNIKEIDGCARLFMCNLNIIRLCSPAMAKAHNTCVSSLAITVDYAGHWWPVQLFKRLERLAVWWLKVHLVIKAKLPRQPLSSGQINTYRHALERILNSDMKVQKWRCGWDISLETELESSFCCITLRGNKGGIRIQD